MLRILSLLACLLLSTLSSWSQQNFWQATGGLLANQDIRSLASNSHGDLFAGTWTAGEVYKTTNNGDSWTVCSALPNPNPVLGLCIDRHDHIFASVFLRGMARSTDNGVTWQMKNAGLTNLATRWTLVDRQGNIWVGSEGGLFCSTDDGESWTNKKPGVYGYMLMDSTGAIVAQENNGYGGAILYRSTNGGTSWSSVAIEGMGVNAVHPDGSYWANSNDSKIFHSTDFGATWTDMHSPVAWTGYTTWMMITPQCEIYYSINGYNTGVLRSTNNGETWQVTNAGLTSTSVIVMYPHPNGFLFLGTGQAGVFRSTVPVTPQDISVSLPRVVTAAGSMVEIPISITNVSGWGIYAYEFTITFNSPDSLLSFVAEPVTAGTLSGQNGWSILANNSAANQIKVAAYGALPLTGQGELVRLKIRTAEAAQVGDSSGLTLSQILFNTGGPVPAIENGSVVIHERVCGDADENGIVQAYDAALTLREAVGPMNPPPPPLTAMGRLNADVSMDGKVQAYDAALILRHVIGLAMPESTATCFGPAGFQGSHEALSLSGSVLGVQRDISQTVVQLRLANAPANMQVYSYSFELTCSAIPGDTTRLELPTLEQSYMATVNRLGNGHFKVAVINPYGVDVAAIRLTLTARYATTLDQINFSSLFLNDAPNADLSLAHITTSIEQSRSGLDRPASYDLIGAYPNPFNPSTRIVFQVPTPGLVQLDVYNLQGTRIKTLRDEEVPAGRQEIFWDGTNGLGQTVATGEYFCVMRAGSFVKAVRLLLLK